MASAAEATTGNRAADVASPSRGLWPAALALWLPFAAYAVSAGPDRLVRFFPDDAFYYLVPAVNLARRGIVSFDGVHVTNGFHPLNFLLVAVLALPTTKAGLLAVTFAIQSLFVVLAVLLVAHHYRRAMSPGTPVLALAIATLPVFTAFVVLSAGLEAALVVLSTAWLFVALSGACRAGFREARRNLVLGLALATLVLARLDAVLALLPLAVALVARLGRPGAEEAWVGRLTRLGCVAAPPAALLSGYLLLNLVFTGHAVPISAHVKSLSLGTTPSWHPSTRGEVAGLVLALLPLAATFVVLARGAWSRDRSGEHQALLLLNAGNVVFYVYLLWGVPHVFRWYFAFPVGCLLVDLVAFTAGLDRGVRRAPGRWTARLVVFTVVVNVTANAAGLVWVGSRERSTSYHLKRVSELVRYHGGDAAVTGTLDAGVIGYFAGGRIINLDGLANDFDYVERYLRSRRVGDYLRREGVTHLLVRDAVILNPDPVAAGTYVEARLSLDPRITLRQRDELFRYDIPGQFSVYYFRLGS